jgi:hypothetical protein
MVLSQGNQNGYRSQRGYTRCGRKESNHVTLLQQIRLWMRTRSRGKQYHDRENDPLLEPYYDISPEATLPQDTSGALQEENR